MTIILIGSRALDVHNPRLVKRVISDTDYVVTEESYESMILLKDYGKLILNEGNVRAWESEDGIVEFTIAQPGDSNSLLIDLVTWDPKSRMVDGQCVLLPSLDVLFTIKSAHRYKKFTDAGRFYKHFTDWHVLKMMGCTIPENYKEFFKLREKESYTYSHPKLNVTKDEFFKDDVPYVYSHDWIHEVVALDGPPAYTKYLIDEVQCSKELFFSLPYETQLQGVIEEACVLAIERSLVPHGTWDARTAWMYAFAKVCSTITSGFFRKFAYDNGLEVIKRYPEDYWTKFQTAMATNPVYHKVTP